MNQEKLWTKQFTLTLLAGFSSSLVITSLLTTMALYVINKFGIGEGLAGFTSSIMMIGSVFGRFFSGRHLDRYSRRRLAVTASILNIAFCALYFLPFGIGAIIVLRLVHGAINGYVGNTLSTAVIDFIPPARRAEGIAIYALNFTLALAVGPTLCMYIAARWSYTALFAANIVFAIVAVVIIAAIKFVDPVLSKEQIERVQSRKGVDAIFDKATLPLAFMIAPLSMCYAGVTAFIETYTGQIGVAWAASAFFTIYGLFIIVSRPVTGRLLDRRGDNFVMLPIMYINAAGVLALGLAGVVSGAAVPALIIASAFMLAIGYGSTLSGGQAIAIKRAEPQDFGRINATYWIFSDGGMGVGALLLGMIAAGAGFSVMFFVEAAISIGALLIYWFLHGRHNRSFVVDDNHVK